VGKLKYLGTAVTNQTYTQDNLKSGFFLLARRKASTSTGQAKKTQRRRSSLPRAAFEHAIPALQFCKFTHDVDEISGDFKLWFCRSNVGTSKNLYSAHIKGNWSTVSYCVTYLFITKNFG
jgi:hypothetical protein